MKTLLASIFVSLSLLLGSCGGAAAGESFAKSITDGLGSVTKAFDGISDKASADKAVSLAESTLPKAATAFKSLSDLGSKAGATDAVKGLLNKATSSFGGVKDMLGGLMAKFAGKPEILGSLKDKIPALLKMLPKMGG